MKIFHMRFFYHFLLLLNLRHLFYTGPCPFTYLVFYDDILAQRERDRERDRGVGFFRYVLYRQQILKPLFQVNTGVILFILYSL